MWAHYVITDVIARVQRFACRQVLQPMGLGRLSGAGGERRDRARKSISRRLRTDATSPRCGPSCSASGSLDRLGNREVGHLPRRTIYRWTSGLFLSSSRRPGLPQRRPRSNWVRSITGAWPMNRLVARAAPGRFRAQGGETAAAQWGVFPPPWRHHRLPPRLLAR